MVFCPYCNFEFPASAGQIDLQVVDDTPEPDADSRVDALRIRHYAKLRMTAIRSRSWWMILQLFCLLCVVNLIAKTALLLWYERRWGLWPTVFAVLAIAASYLGRFSAAKAAYFKQEIERSVLIDPEHPPDFSTLSDGKEQWKKLENIR
jgi:hypothetical protein